jgi:hypothetical protein
MCVMQLRNAAALAESRPDMLTADAAPRAVDAPCEREQLSDRSLRLSTSPSGTHRRTTATFRSARAERRSQVIVESSSVVLLRQDDRPLTAPTDKTIPGCGCTPRQREQFTEPSPS